MLRHRIPDIRSLCTDISGHLAYLWREKTGNIALIFALSLLPIVAATGAAVDVSRALQVRARLASALDAAGLAAGRSVSDSEEVITDVANAYFQANYPASELGVPGELSVAITDNVITLTADAQIDTTIMKLFGFDEINVGAATEITRETTGLEVALVLDNTGSMASNNKIGALRTATVDLINILFGEEAFPEKLKVSIVPFVTSVNVNNASWDMDWIDTNAESMYHGENFNNEDGAPISHMELFDRVGNTDWKGCVEARPEPFDTTDDAPNAGNPDTLWVPYFWPDEPGGNNTGSFHNKYRADSVSGSQQARQRSLVKYNGSNDFSIDETPSSTLGPNKSCPDVIEPLTNDRDLLLQRADDLIQWSFGGTNVPQGMAWGWRVLSPTPPFTEGAEYDDPEVNKAMIILTDGRNEFVTESNFNRSDYTGYGYLGKQRLGPGINTPSEAEPILDEKVVQLCENIKAEGIRVYTITFQLTSGGLIDIFRDCATTPAQYFDSPSNEDLQEVFQTIATELSNLRISR